MARRKKEGSSGFGGRLKALREGAGFTQADLAERAGLNSFTVSKIEQGLRDPNWTTAMKLAAALGVNCLAFEGAAPAGVAT